MMFWTKIGCLLKMDDAWDDEWFAFFVVSDLETHLCYAVLLARVGLALIFESCVSNVNSRCRVISPQTLNIVSDFNICFFCFRVAIFLEQSAGILQEHCPSEIERHATTDPAQEFVRISVMKAVKRLQK